MVVVKSYPEASDKDAIYWNGDAPIEDLIGSINSDTIEFQGSDVVSLAFNRPLSEVVGCRIRVGNKLVTANYRYSESGKYPGRANAFRYIHTKYRPILEIPECKELTSKDQLKGECVAFDCESGGPSKIRVITFYDGTDSWYVDCRDLKSNQTKRDMLTGIFTSDIDWIAHNFACDCELICNTLKIPFFRVYIDTITLLDGYEFRNLGYLSGVVLGVPPYKHELEIANNTKDFQALVRYCAKDSFYTYILASKVRTPSQLFVNQFIHTMLYPPKLEPRDSIFKYYPQWQSLKKKELKACLGEVDTRYAQLLLKAITPPKPKISLHTGFKVVIPEDLTYQGTLYMRTSSGATDVLEAMALDAHFSGAEVSAYRYTHGIEPKYWEPMYPIKPEDVFLLNDVVCLTTKPTEGFTACTFNSIRGLFYGP